MFCLPQLVQTLRYDNAGYVAAFLRSKAEEKARFATVLLWTLQGEEAPPWRREPREGESSEELKQPVIKRSGWKEPEDNAIWPIVERVRHELLQGMKGKALFESEAQFLSKVMSISSELKDLSMEERKRVIIDHLRCVRTLVLLIRITLGCFIITCAGHCIKQEL